MESLANAALSNSLVAAALTLIAVVVSRLLRNKPAIAHVLWLLVLVKLVTPPVFSVPVTWPQPNAITKVVRPPDLTPVVGVDVSVLEQQLAELRVAQAGRTRSLPWLQIFVCIWLLGSVLWLFRAGRRIGRFNHLLKTAEFAPEDLQTKTLRLAKRMGMRRAPRVLLIDGEVPPMVWCVGWIPRIFLPTVLVAGVSARQLELILAHELAHVKRRDYLIRWFELMMLGLYWWNPIAWLAVRRLRTAEEHCCDAMVVELDSGNARKYVETLVQVVDILAERRSVPSLASGIGSSPSLKGRCEMILKNNTSSHVGRFACLLILGIGVTVLPFSVQARPKNDSSSDLEKRITRLEKVIDNLRKALGRDAAVEAGLSSKPRQAPLIHKERPLPALGQDKKTREEMLNAIKRLDQQQRAAGGGPKLETRLKVYEMAFRRQAAVTELQKKATQLKAELRSIEQQIKKWQKSASDNNTLFLPLKRK